MTNDQIHQWLINLAQLSLYIQKTNTNLPKYCYRRSDFDAKTANRNTNYDQFFSKVLVFSTNLLYCNYSVKLFNTQLARSIL